MINRLRSIKHLLLNTIQIFFQRKKIPCDSLDDTFLVMLAADYNNLGDVAITYAQTQFLRQHFPKYKVIEIPLSDTCKVYLDMRKKINNSTIITLIGGGNTSDKYELIERLRRFIIRRFKSNKIISFPQTIDFSNTSYGRYSLEKSINDYKKNDNLILCARETRSEKTYEQNFHNKVYLIPDIVLSLDYKKNKERNGAITLLRNDGERNIDDNFADEINELLIQEYGNYKKSDTSINHFDAKNKYAYFKKLLNIIATKEIAITDRLHGMIFCYITRTPCIVFLNNNHKIEQTYKNWLSNCNYIKLEKEKDIKKVKKHISSLQSLRITDNNSGKISKKLMELVEIIETLRV